MSFIIDQFERILKKNEIILKKQEKYYKSTLKKHQENPTVLLETFSDNWTWNLNIG